MPKRLIKQWIPKSHTIRNHPYISMFGTLLHDPNLWHLNRRSVSGGFAVGLFIAFMPIPFQMVVAAAIAIGSRVNIVVSVVLCWITNPITITPFFYTAYTLGNLLLGEKGGKFSFEMSWAWLQSSLGSVWQPLLLGCFILAVTSAILGSLTIRLLWRWQVVQNWEKRGKLRHLRKKHAAHIQANSDDSL
ncbi:MAG: flagellar biosynthesis protein FlhF [Gammaproteobacteria bacterium]|nr:DUF2062 domain-containing protein [Beggiatoa alba]PCH59289.1 MAG: flagellar biosynthesis protein FlhF [Gammaproteobacteria bacterium]